MTYYYKHKHLIRDFFSEKVLKLQNSRTEIKFVNETESEGQKSAPEWVHEYPTEEEYRFLIKRSSNALLEQMPRLMQIKYKIGTCDTNLCMIELVYDNGVSKMFASSIYNDDLNKNETETVNIDKSQAIATINVIQGHQWLSFEFLDKESKVIARIGNPDSLRELELGNYTMTR